MEREASYINFYAKHKISPVRQDLSDLSLHFERREALYRQCGVLPFCFNKRSVLEVGPGSGHNSIYIASLKPSRYLLVDGNQEGIDQINDTFNLYPEYRANVEVKKSLLEDLDTSEQFDVVLCEGMLPYTLNNAFLLEKLATAVNPGGILVITCVDAVSFFAERLRRLLAVRLVEPDLPLEKKVIEFHAIFSSHLDTLKSMSRRYDDWFIDNLVNPVALNPYLSIVDAIALVKDSFDVLSSSPSFFQDIRWYKEITGKSRAYNENAEKQYWGFLHNLLDYRFVSPPRPEAANRELLSLCSEITDRASAFELEKDERHIRVMGPLFNALSKNVAGFSTTHSSLIAELWKMLEAGNISASDISTHTKFAAFFGRGMQYLSFTKVC